MNDYFISNWSNGAIVNLNDILFRLASSNEETALEAVIGLLQKMPPRQQGEVKKLLESLVIKDTEIEDMEIREVN